MSAVHFHTVSCFVDETNFYFSYNSYKIHHVYRVIVLHAYIHAQPHLVAGINCDPLSKNWPQQNQHKIMPSTCTLRARTGSMVFEAKLCQILD